MSYDATILADSPVGYWPLNESSGTAALDQSGNGNNGVYSGAFALGATTGLLDGETGVNFTGGKMALADAVALRLGAGNISLECWFNISTLPGFSAVWDNGTSNVTRAYSCFLNGGSAAGLYLDFGKGLGGGGTGVTMSASLLTGHLYHFVITSNHATVNVYVNGVNVLTTTAAGIFGAGGNSDTGVQLFANPSGGGGGTLKGIAAKFAIYNTVLTSTQVAAHYTAGTTVSVTANPSTLKWDLAAQVAATPATLKWDLRTAATGTPATLKWDLRTAVNATAATVKWDLRSAVDANPRTLSWNLAATADANPATLAWDLYTQAETIRALKWDLYTPATATRSIAWNLYTQTDPAVRTLVWNLNAKSTKWQQTTQTPWSEQNGADWAGRAGGNWPEQDGDGWPAPPGSSPAYL